LIELLIVVFIIAILFQLALPAIQSSREAARRAACQNNLRQIGIALQGYESVKRGLPIGSLSCCMGTWMPAIFPYMEQGEAFEAYTNEPAAPGMEPPRYDDDVNLEVTQRSYSSFSCPSDRTQYTGSLEISKHSYVVNYGNTAITGNGLRDIPVLAVKSRSAVKNYEGVEFEGAPFFVQRNYRTPETPVKLAEITDGTSHTLFASEVVQATGQDIRGTVWHSHSSGFMTFLGPNSSEADKVHVKHHCKSAGFNPPCRMAREAEALATSAARSRHPGGVNAVKGDGSVQFHDDDVDLNVWRALSTTQGGDAAY
jgi:prepilin-type processing-associated H-X9-DG protein